MTWILELTNHFCFNRSRRLSCTGKAHIAVVYEMQALHLFLCAFQSYGSDTLVSYLVFLFFFIVLRATLISHNQLIFPCMEDGLLKISGIIAQPDSRIFNSWDVKLIMKVLNATSSKLQTWQMNNDEIDPVASNPYLLYNKFIFKIIILKGKLGLDPLTPVHQYS